MGWPDRMVVNLWATFFTVHHQIMWLYILNVVYIDCHTRYSATHI